LERVAVKILLDTQAWLWWLHSPDELSGRARTAIREAEQKDGILISAISVWEVAVKQALGKLQIPMEIHEWFRQASQYKGVTIEPVLPTDAIDSTLLPGKFHKDPADRIIVAVARRHSVPIVTSDEEIRSYQHVESIW
jgi:PIN domain nuclease of toxin-antitoxin system